MFHSNIDVAFGYRLQTMWRMRYETPKTTVAGFARTSPKPDAP